MKLDNIKIKGHIGTWHVIDTQVFNGTTYCLLEHDDYGDEAAGLIVKYDEDSFVLILDDVWNGWSDFFDFLET